MKEDIYLPLTPSQLLVKEYSVHDYLYYDALRRWQYEYDQLDEWDRFEMDVFWAVKL